MRTRRELILASRVMFCLQSPQWLKAIVALFLLLGTSAWLHATTSITLTWPANTDPSIEGYNVYYGTNSGKYTTSTDVGNVTNAVIANLNEGWTYYFAVTAYDLFGLESLPSPEMVYTIPSTNNVVRFCSGPRSLQPNQLTMNLEGPVGSTAVLQVSTNSVTWKSVCTNLFVSTNLVMNVFDNPSNIRMHLFRVMLQ
jgi:hypothetical protein